MSDSGVQELGFLLVFEGRLQAFELQGFVKEPGRGSEEIPRNKYGKNRA